MMIQSRPVSYYTSCFSNTFRKLTNSFFLKKKHPLVEFKVVKLLVESKMIPSVTHVLMSKLYSCNTC